MFDLQPSSLIDEAQFFGGSERVVQRLGTSSSGVVRAVQRRLTGLMLRIQRLVVDDFLHGGVLHWRTGRLARSVHYDVVQDPHAITGTIHAGKEAPYGRIHEFGGDVEVPAHMRINPAIRHLSMTNVATGRTRTVRQRLELSTPIVFVRSYTAHYAERSFIRRGVRENREAFFEAVRAGVAEGARA